MQVHNTPLLIDGDGEQMQVIVGAGGAGVTYGPSQTLVTTNSAAAGSTFQITAPFWIQSQDASKAADLQLITQKSPSSGSAAASGSIGIDPTAYGADPTGIGDSTAAFQSAYADAANLGHYTLLVPPGVYNVSAPIHGGAASTGYTSNPVRVVARVPWTVTIQRTASTPIVQVVGTRTNAVALAADAPAGTTTLTLNALPPGGLSVENLVELSSNVPFATGVGSSAATYAEIVRVKSVAGTGPYTITLYGPTEEAYAIANAGALARVDYVGQGSLLSGINFRQTATGRDSVQDPLVRFALCKDVRIEKCMGHDADTPAFELRGVLNVDVDDVWVENLIDNNPTQIGYGFNVTGNSRDVTIRRPRGRWVRHVFTTSWGTFPGPANSGDIGVPRHISIIDGKAWETSSGPWNTHKEGRFIEFINCQVHNDINNGFYIRCKDVTIINPTVVNTGRGAAGWVSAVFFAENESSDGIVIGGRIIGGPNSFAALQSASPRTHFIGTRCFTTANGGTVRFESGATDWIVEDIYSKDPNATAHIVNGAAGLNGIVRGGRYISTVGSKAIVSAGAAGDIVVAGTPNGTNIFAIDQNQRAIVDQQSTVTQKSGAYTLTDIDGHVLFDATAAARTATLPAPTAAHVGRRHVITKKDASANAVTIATLGGSLFGTTSLTAQGQTVRAYSDGTNWYVS